MWTHDDTVEVARRRLKRSAELEKSLELRRQEGQREGQRIAVQAAEADLTVVRVWGFGSVFETNRPFRMDSDIDLAVEGGGTAGWSVSQKSLWKVDWVELADQAQTFSRHVKEKGVLLYERH